MTSSGMPQEKEAGEGDRSSARGTPWGDVGVMLIFMTRLPLRFPGVIETPRLARAQWSLPIVGLLIGSVVGGVLWAAAALGLPVLAAAFVAIGAGLLLTGALHEDGLADCADAFGGGQDVTAKLTILRDSRIGTYGTVALVTALGMRAALLAPLALFGWRGLVWVAAAAAISRGLIPLAMRASRPVRRDGLGTMAGIPPAGTVAVCAALMAMIVAVATLLSVMAGPAGWGAAVALALIPAVAAAAACAAVMWLAGRQIGGYTGDVLGASQQVSELAFLATVIAVLA